MNPTIFLGCLVVLSGCLLLGVNAQGADGLLQVYGYSAVDEDTRYRNVADLVSFLDIVTRFKTTAPGSFEQL